MKMKIVTASQRTDATATRSDRYHVSFSAAQEMMIDFPDLEIRSALKEAGSRNGIAWGDDMGDFVHWAEKRMGL